MTDLERMELALRRVHAHRQRGHDEDGKVLNVDIQELLADLAAELAVQNVTDRR